MAYPTNTKLMAWQTVCRLCVMLVLTRTEPHALNAPQTSLHQAGVSAWHIGLKKYWTAKLDVLLIHIRYLTPKDSLALHAHQTLDHHRGVNPYWSVRVMMVSPKSEKIVYFNAPQASLYQAGVVAWQTVCVMLVSPKSEKIVYFNALQASLY